MGIAKGTRLAITKSELPPCCLRIHPNDDRLVLVGTYKLEDSGFRHGSVDIFQLEDDGQLILKNSYKTASAVLDLKFDPFGCERLVTAHSTGCLTIWKCTGDELEEGLKLQLFEEDNLVTSVFFDPMRRGKVLVTLTSGEAALVDLETSSMEILDLTHDLECWTGSFGEIGELSNVVFTGGDDAKVICHDTRTKSSIWNTSRRHHDAGVVSILSLGPQWNTANPHHLFTGSYDDNLRLFDLRLMDKANPLLVPGIPPSLIAQENLGGGVWRLCPGPDSQLLVCCMYDGARIVKTQGEKWTVSSTFVDGHESICYGGDWSKSDYVSTCSFYDKVIQVWAP